MKRALPFVLAAVGLALAAGLALLALDIRAWQDAFAAGDAKYEAGARAPTLWEPSDTLPDALTRRLLGVGDDVAYRQGLRLYKVARPRLTTVLNANMPAFRAQAEDVLGQAVGKAHDPAAKSRLMNLLGVLAVAQAAEDPENATGRLEGALASFRAALRLDPGNEDAQTNLELLLRLQQQQAQQPNSRTDRGSEAPNNVGIGRAGSGY